MSLLKIKSFVIDDTTANDAFGQANSAASFANGAFGQANSAAAFANGSFITANSAGSFANGAFVTANSAGSFANGAFVTANSAASFANGAFVGANSAYDQANSAASFANSSFVTSNSAATFANGAFITANNAASFANAAFITANTVYGWGNHASVGYATISYVGTEIANLVNSAPSTLDTLNELATALGNDANFSTTITTTLGITNSFANGAFLRANASYIAQNTTASFANGSFDKANSSGSFANGAFVTANASYLAQNTTASFANAAFTQANTDVTNISIVTGVYGGASVAPVITVAANGRIIAVSNVSISGGGGGGGASVTVGPTAPSPAANGYLWYDDTSTGELFVYSSGSWVTTSIMPATNANDPVITGPTQANEATTQTFTISNYNGSHTYIIGVTGGSVSRTNQSIYWTMPSVTTNTTHYMTTQVVIGGATSAVDTRTVLVVDLNVDDTAIVVSDFSTSYANTNYGWTV